MENQWNTYQLVQSPTHIKFMPFIYTNLIVIWSQCEKIINGKLSKRDSDLLAHNIFVFCIEQNLFFYKLI